MSDRSSSKPTTRASSNPLLRIGTLRIHDYSITLQVLAAIIIIVFLCSIALQFSRRVGTSIIVFLFCSVPVRSIAIRSIADGRIISNSFDFVSGSFGFRLWFGRLFFSSFFFKGFG
jgi:hypothetical protein